MKWKGLIITAVVTAILGLMLTLYSCKPGSVKEESVEVEQVEATTLPGSGEGAKKDEAVCTATSCEAK